MNEILEHSDFRKGGLPSGLVVDLDVVLMIDGRAQGLHELLAEVRFITSSIDCEQGELRRCPCDEAASSKGIVTPLKILKSSCQCGDVGFRHSNLSLDRCGTAKVEALAAASSVCGGGLRPFVNAFPEAA